MLRHLVYAVESLVDLLLALEAERDGNDAYREDVEFLRHTGDNRRSTRTCSAAHSGGDEGHLRAVAEHRLDIVDALLGSLTRLLGLVAGSESFLAELQLHGHGRIVERLHICVAEHERHVVYALTVHVVDGIAAASTYTNHLNNSILFFRCTEVHHRVDIV